MTIEVKGYIDSLSHAGPDKVSVCVSLESARVPEKTFTVIASAKEIDIYRVGMDVIMQIRPMP